MTRHEVTSLGETVRVQPGDEVVVRLAENPTTGYRWEIDAPRGGVEVADDSYDRPRDEGVGAGGMRTFTLRAGDPGEAEVRLRLARSWENEAVEQGSLAIVVEPSDQP